MTIPIVLWRKMRPQRLTDSDRFSENPPRGFELIKIAARWWIVNRDGPRRRHCEERSDEAIQFGRLLDCFASLAMTAEQEKSPKNA